MFIKKVPSSLQTIVYFEHNHFWLCHFTVRTCVIYVASCMPANNISSYTSSLPHPSGTCINWVQTTFANFRILVEVGIWPLSDHMIIKLLDMCFTTYEHVNIESWQSIILPTHVEATSGPILQHYYNNISWLATQLLNGIIFCKVFDHLFAKFLSVILKSVYKKEDRIFYVDQ